MKKIYTISIVMLLSAVLAPLSLSAASYITRNGIRYVYNSSKTTVTVTKPASGSTYVGEIVVPESIVNGDGNTIPVVGVNSSAFSDCTYLTSVILPASATSIGDYAFDSCENLEKVEMPGVKTIGHWSFRNCYKLADLKFPDVLTSIGNYAFDKNYLMATVDLPASVTNLGGYVFEGIPELTTVICRGTTPPAVKKGYLDGEEIYTIFDDTDYSGRSLYVPEEAIQTYKTALGWHHFQNNIFPISDLSAIETIATPAFTVSSPAAGTIEISSPAATEVNIFNINGQLVKKVAVKEGSTTVSGLPSGILIAGGVKIVVR